jgi:hypothetical protein
VGDLFLFFGWFRQSKDDGNDIRFVAGAPDLHVIFGWLQVGRVVNLPSDAAAELPWARMHPHFAAPDRYRNNTVYIASDRLTSVNSFIAGAGVFDALSPELILTQSEPYLGRSTWRLPSLFHPDGRTPLSRHHAASRWNSNGSTVQLRSVPIGQEFVLDLDEYPEAVGWLRKLFRCAINSERERASARTLQLAAGTRTPLAWRDAELRVKASNEVR